MEWMLLYTADNCFLILSGKQLNPSQRHGKVHKSVSPLLATQVYGFKTSKETFATKRAHQESTEQEEREPFLQ